MRTFVDTEGRPWQAALMDGSYGSVELIFGRVDGGEVLHRALDAQVTHVGQAEQLLANLDEAGLRACLAAATPWP